MHDVFISYSTKDSSVADAICHIFEENNVKCWYAGRRSGPADLTPGLSYSSEIVKGLKETKVVVLVLSSNSNRSHNVLNEIEVATNEQKVVIPFRIEKSELSDDMYYYVKRLHWLEALTEPRQEKIIQLLKKVQHVLSLPAEATSLQALEKSNDQLSIEIKREAKEISAFLEEGKIQQAKQQTYHFLTGVFQAIDQNQSADLTLEKMESLLDSKSSFTTKQEKRMAMALYELLSFVKNKEKESSTKLSKYQSHIKQVSDWFDRKTKNVTFQTRDKSPSNTETTTVNVTKITNTINGDVNAPFSVTGNVTNRENNE